MADVDVDAAAASGSASGAGVIANDGFKVAGGTRAGGYTLISATTVLWMEVGDLLPGQPLFNTVIPFADTGSTVPLALVGGRSYDHYLEISSGGAPVDITGALFISQIRDRNGDLLAEFIPTITDGPGGLATLHLEPWQTEVAALRAKYGFWDVEMHLNGREDTIIPKSQVTITLGVSQGMTWVAAEAYGEAIGYPGSVVAVEE